MAVSLTNCGNGTSSTYCTCKDYYGFYVSQYKYYNEDKGVFNCCNILSNYIKYEDSESNTKILDYVKSSQSENCQDFFKNKYPGIKDDEELKQELPMIYWQGLMNASLFQDNRFTKVPVLDSQGTVSCDEGDIPVFLSYEDYESKMKQNKLLCTGKNLNRFKDIKFLGTDIPIPYSVRYVKNSLGNDCVSNSCKLNYDITYTQYNIGSELYKSKGELYDKKGLNISLYIIIGVVFITFGFGGYYYFSKNRKKDKRTILSPSKASQSNNVSDSGNAF